MVFVITIVSMIYLRTIYLPGFGLKARSEVPQGPAMQVTAQPPVAGMPTRKLSDGGHGGAGHLPPPPGSGRVDLPAGDPHLSGGRRDQHRHPDHFRGRATRNSEQSAGHGGQGPIPNRRTIASAQGEPLQLPGEPLTGEECDLPEEDVHTAQRPRTSEWYNTNGNMLLGRPFSARARPSSAPRPTSPSRKPWIPPGIPQGHQMPPTLLNLDSSRPRSAPRRRSRPMSAQQSKRNGPWPGRRVAPWMDTARAGLPESWPDGNDFARGTTL